MTTEPDERVDKTLRDAFAVDEESVRRVSAGALAPPPLLTPINRKRLEAFLL